jgi:hypothetical protein
MRELSESSRGLNPQTGDVRATSNICGPVLSKRKVRGRMTSYNPVTADKSDGPPACQVATVARPIPIGIVS